MLKNLKKKERKKRRKEKREKKALKLHIPPTKFQQELYIKK